MRNIWKSVICVLLSCPKFIFNTTVKCLQITIVYLSFLTFATLSLAKSKDSGYAENPFLPISWRAIAKFATTLFSLTIFKNHFQSHLILVFLWVLTAGSSKYQKEAFRENMNNIVLEASGNGFQVIGTVHLQYFWCSLQGHFLSVAA